MYYVDTTHSHYLVIRDNEDLGKDDELVERYERNPISRRQIAEKYGEVEWLPVDGGSC